MISSVIIIGASMALGYLLGLRQNMKPVLDKISEKYIRESKAREAEIKEIAKGYQEFLEGNARRTQAYRDIMADLKKITDSI